MPISGDAGTLVARGGGQCLILAVGCKGGFRLERKLERKHVYKARAVWKAREQFTRSPSPGACKLKVMAHTAHHAHSRADVRACGLAGRADTMLTTLQGERKMTAAT